MAQSGDISPLFSHTKGMCTAVCFENLCGRTLDHDRGYGEQVVLCPRNAPLSFKKLPKTDAHFALLGMATVAEETPLYYDAINEQGLFMAGLLFAGNAVYLPPKERHYNLAPYELIPWILGQCPDLKAAKALLARVNVTAEPFSAEFPLSPLHWIIADRSGSLTLEPCADGLKIYENPFGVLTNNPPFEMQINRLADYLNLTPKHPIDRFGQGILTPYSRGMGAIGLPGDWSSASRFVRAAFVRRHLQGNDPAAFFHCMDTVAVPKGVALSQEGEPIYTRYTCCCDLAAGTYSYTAYDHRAPVSVSLQEEDLNGRRLIKKS